MIRHFFCLASLLAFAGCGILPEVTHKPVIRNPFPQLHRVAVLPFINLSDEPTLDGRKFSIAYFTELQSIPGFAVVPLAVVEQEIGEVQGRKAIELRAQLDEMGLQSSDRDAYDRIVRLLDRFDFPTANEFIGIVSNGKPLPAASTQNACRSCSSP